MNFLRFTIFFFVCLFVFRFVLLSYEPGRVAQSVGHLTSKSGVLGSIPGLATYFRFTYQFFKKSSCQLLAKVCARSNRLGGLSLPRKSLVRLTDCPDTTLDVYRGRKTTMQQCNFHMRDPQYSHAKAMERVSLQTFSENGYTARFNVSI